jgi:hypothetical protein
MSHAKWRSPGAYEHLRPRDAAGFAWEFVSRNFDFQHDCERLADICEQGAPTA